MSNNANIFQDNLQISETAKCLVGFSGTASQPEGTFEQALPAALSSISMNSGWTVAWGPAAWKSETSPETGDNKSNKAVAAEHIVFVGHGCPIFEDGQTCPVYVVSIGIMAGLSELMNEIFGINLVIDLDQWAGSGVSGLGTEPTPIETQRALKDESSYIANGLGQVLFHLMNHSPIFKPSETLLQCVQRLRKDKPSAKIVFTGHSIGGALASLLAYVLAKTGVIGSTPSSNAYVYPTGAPSPGNRAFA